MNDKDAEIRRLRSALIKNAAALARLLHHDDTTESLDRQLYQIMAAMRSAALRLHPVGARDMNDKDEYREIYHKLQGHLPDSMFAHGVPTNTDDLLREEGVDVHGSDVIPVSQSALFILLVRRVRKLEEDVAALTGVDALKIRDEMRQKK